MWAISRILLAALVFLAAMLRNLAMRFCSVASSLSVHAFEVQLRESDAEIDDLVGEEGYI